METTKYGHEIHDLHHKWILQQFLNHEIPEQVQWKSSFFKEMTIC